MKKLLLVLIAFAWSSYSYADAFEKDKEKCIPCSQPKKVTKPKPAPVAKPVQESSCCKTDCCGEKKTESTSAGTGQSSSVATTGTQSIVVNIPQPTKIVERRITRTKIRTKKVFVYNPNRFQFLLGASKTKMEVRSDDCCNLTATRKYEPDVGLQYLRDFGSFTGSVTATSNEAFYLGLGVNW